MKIIFVKRFIFIGLLLAITINAHFSENSLYNFLHTIGLDLPLTPFTADMTLMLENKTKAYYTRDFLVRYQADREIHDLKIEDLGWYEFKAPFQWISECQERNEVCFKVQYFLCRSLSDHTGRKVHKWKTVEIGNSVLDKSSGIGVSFSCYN